MRGYSVCCFVLAILLAAPLYSQPISPNSVVSNDLDFIREDDPSFGFCLKFQSVQRAEMPGQPNGELFADNVNVFAAEFVDGDVLELWAHPDIGSQDDVRAVVEPVAQAIARLPVQMRTLLDHVVINKGDKSAFAEDLGRFFTVYSENIAKRISTNDISETVFHESVHATIDVPHKSTPEWKAAQQADGQYITEYAQEKPDGEDMAESALFAWAVLKYPGRLPAEIEAQVRAIMPNRLAYFDRLFRDWTLPSAKDSNLPC